MGRALCNWVRKAKREEFPGLWNALIEPSCSWGGRSSVAGGFPASRGRISKGIKDVEGLSSDKMAQTSLEGPKSPLPWLLSYFNTATPQQVYIETFVNIEKAFA